MPEPKSVHEDRAGHMDELLKTPAARETERLAKEKEQKEAEEKVKLEKEKKKKEEEEEEEEEEDTEENENENEDNEEDVEEDDKDKDEDKDKETEDVEDEDKDSELIFLREQTKTLEEELNRQRQFSDDDIKEDKKEDKKEIIKSKEGISAFATEEILSDIQNGDLDKFNEVLTTIASNIEATVTQAVEKRLNSSLTKTVDNRFDERVTAHDALGRFYVDNPRLKDKPNWVRQEVRIIEAEFVKDGKVFKKDFTFEDILKKVGENGNKIFREFKKKDAPKNPKKRKGGEGMKKKKVVKDESSQASKQDRLLATVRI